MSIQEFTDKVKTDIATQLKSFTDDKLTVDQCLLLIEMPRSGNADYQVTIGKLNRFKKDYKMSAKPGEIAQDWGSKFKPTELVTKAEGCAQGYISFYIDKIGLSKAVVKEVLTKKGDYGKTNVGAGKTVLVEFSSPNIAKVFHAGHLRSTILGNFLQNVYRATGHNVVSYNYLGDWGKQYGLLAVAFARYGDREKLKAQPIRHLYDLYVKANAQVKVEGDEIDAEARAYFAKMEAGDEEALGLWREFRELSIEEYKRIYARLNVSFDIFSGESQVGEGMEAAYKVMQEKELLTLSQGAQLIDLESRKKGLGKCLIKKTDGSSLYLTRDVAAAKGRWDKHQFDKMLYVVGTAQSLHFNQLFKVLELMDYDWSKKCEHINFGLVCHTPSSTSSPSPSLASASSTSSPSSPSLSSDSSDSSKKLKAVTGMSSRKGTAVFLEDMLDEAKTAMLNIMRSNAEKFKDVEDPETVADIVGMSAVIIQDLSAKRHKNYDFNWDRMTSNEGETGPYLQYSHARLASILRKAETEVNMDADLSLVTEPQGHALAVEISKFPEVVVQACNKAEPVNLVQYLFSLARAINAAFQVLQVKGSEKPLAEARLLLFESGRITLRNGMELLGLTPVDRM